MNEFATAIADAAAQTDLLKDLLDVGAGLTAGGDRREMLETILTEARRLGAAQAGSLYVRTGDHLEFVVAQNDAVAESPELPVGRRIRIGDESLAGFCAAAGEAINVPDTYHLPPGTPFRIEREFDALTGCRGRSALAIPLKCSSGQVVGVLQLVNRLGEGGTGAFPDTPPPALASLASMAGMSVHNVMLAEQLRQAQIDTITRLSVVAEFRDRNTAEHIRRISDVCGRVADAMGLDAQPVELLRCASTMHDIGKVGIPDSILLKPGPLTPEERKIVETHTVIGADILGNPTNDLLAMARQIALSHHERWDGRGYPHRLKGERIPLPARVVGLADVFDALATERCYKKAYPIGKVVEIVRAVRGRHFDPDVTDAFFKVFDDIIGQYDLPEDAPPRGRA